MNPAFRRLSAILLSALLIALSTAGCSSRPAAAQKLFDKGEYQAVMDKYPDLEIARRARAKLAEQIVEKGDFRTVIAEYPDTPAAYRARTELAQQMFDQGQYRALVDSFPHSPMASLAKERLADTLFAAGQLDELVRLYPETPRGKAVKDERAATELAQIKKMRGDAKKTALEQFMSKYAGTEAYKEAGQILSSIREGEAKRNQGKAAAAAKTPAPSVSSH